MKFKAVVTIMPQKEILDPQGKAVLLGLKNLEIPSITDCRIGKSITLQLDAENEEKAHETVKEATTKLLANLIMEEFSYELTEA